jgi:hypothetical protein
MIKKRKRNRRAIPTMSFNAIDKRAIAIGGFSMGLDFAITERLTIENDRSNRSLKF